MSVRRALALGFFDGVHEAHRAVLSLAREAADASSMTAAAVTFDRHPAAAVSGKPQELLQQLSDRVEMLRTVGHMDEVIVLTFDEHLQNEPWEDFIEYLVRDLNAGYVSVGYDFRFGKNAEGTVEHLREALADREIPCGIVERMDTPDGKPWGARDIRSLLRSGDAEHAAFLMGHPFTFSGEVLHGKSLGHTLGFPTMNIPVPADMVQPAAGVYASKAVVDGTEYNSVTNVSEVGLSETFVFDYSGNAYGKIVRISLLKFVRPMRKFASYEDLAAQVERDKEIVNSQFAIRN